MAISTTKMTRKGQITIPADIRNALDLHEGDHFVVRQDEHRVVLERASDIVDRTAGVFARYARDAVESSHEERAWFEQAVADEVAASLAAEATDQDGTP